MLSSLALIFRDIIRGTLQERHQFCIPFVIVFVKLNNRFKVYLKDSMDST